MTINQAFTILSNAGGIRAARIITENTKKLSRFKVLRMARQLRRGMPVAKIIHKKWFYGMGFYTNRYTLDPRPDTETLVSAVIADAGNGIRILDLGTGTGCIIAACVNNIPGASGIGIDKSWRACRVAKKNIRAHNITSRIEIRRRSFSSQRGFGEKFDVIVSNPPYIARGDARVDIGAGYDPRMALYAGDNGRSAYREIAKNARRWIKPDGRMYTEIGIDMGPDIREIFAEYGWQFIRAESDLGGIERVLVFSYR